MTDSEKILTFCIVLISIAFLAMTIVLGTQRDHAREELVQIKKDAIEFECARYNPRTGVWEFKSTK